MTPLIPRIESTKVGSISLAYLIWPGSDFWGDQIRCDTCTGGAQPPVARARAPVCPSLATPLARTTVSLGIMLLPYVHWYVTSMVGTIVHSVPGLGMRIHSSWCTWPGHA